MSWRKLVDAVWQNIHECQGDIFWHSVWAALFIFFLPRALFGAELGQIVFLLGIFAVVPFWALLFGFGLLPINWWFSLAGLLAFVFYFASASLVIWLWMLSVSLILNLAGPVTVATVFAALFAGACLVLFIIVTAIGWFQEYKNR